jgi:hypothetical protein
VFEASSCAGYSWVSDVGCGRIVTVATGCGAGGPAALPPHAEANASKTNTESRQIMQAA